MLRTRTVEWHRDVAEPMYDSSSTRLICRSAGAADSCTSAARFSDATALYRSRSSSGPQHASSARRSLSIADRTATRFTCSPLV